MKLLKDLLDIASLNRDIADGYISVHTHPEAKSLKILNYTQKAQFAGHWTDATRKSRGLIIWDEQNSGENKLSISKKALIGEVAWAKFFTAEQAMLSDWGKLKLVDEENHAVVQAYAELDVSSPVSVTEKLDGSLAIAYRFADEVKIATRGSFDGLQAKMVSQWLQAHPDYPKIKDVLYSDYAQKFTYLFEWIGPSNPIVLPYPVNKLVFLGTVNKETGIYEGTDEWSEITKFIDVAPTWQVHTLAEALALPISNSQEGFVIRYLDHGINDEIAMIKIKGEYYLRLHHAMYSLTTGNIYELVKTGGQAAINQITNTLPTTVGKQIFGYASELIDAHCSLLKEARAINATIESSLPDGYTQKDYAKAAKSYDHLKSLLFIVHSKKDKDNKRLFDLAWRMLKPQRSELVLGKTPPDFH
jgi:hypothetical protein